MIRSPARFVTSDWHALTGHSICVIAVILLVTGCSAIGNGSKEPQRDDDAIALAVSTASSTVHPTHEPTAVTATQRPSRTPTVETDNPPPSPTPVPTSTETPSPTSTATATIKPSPTAAGKCSERVPSDDLHTLVTAEFGISADYVPSDLVKIADHLPLQITRGYDTQIRQIVLEPLLGMIIDMQRAGLQPEIISGYRSFSAQAIAWAKWLEREPDRAATISVPPGHSEHQLGTTIDFGSPELADIIGEEDVDFHTYFYKTSEGEWLAEHAHEYGFTLSYPLDALEITGFYYEPWHYRYIGVDLATQLHENEVSLTQYLLETLPPPCFL